MFNKFISIFAIVSCGFLFSLSAEGELKIDENCIDGSCLPAAESDAQASENANAINEVNLESEFNAEPKECLSCESCPPTATEKKTDAASPLMPFINAN